MTTSRNAGPGRVRRGLPLPEAHSGGISSGLGVHPKKSSGRFLGRHVDSDTSQSQITRIIHLFRRRSVLEDLAQVRAGRSLALRPKLRVREAPLLLR